MYVYGMEKEARHVNSSRVVTVMSKAEFAAKM
jgi:hypothetical protein